MSYVIIPFPFVRNAGLGFLKCQASKPVIDRISNKFQIV